MLLLVVSSISGNFNFYDWYPYAAFSPGSVSLRVDLKIDNLSLKMSIIVDFRKKWEVERKFT